MSAGIDPTPRPLGRGAWVGYRADRSGYDVTVYDPESREVYTYNAGNHPNDSQVYLGENGKGRVPLPTLRKWARQTAQDIAAEWSIGIEMVQDESGE